MQKSTPPGTHSSMASSSSSNYPPRCPFFPTISEHASEGEDGSPDKSSTQEAQHTREITAYKHQSRRLVDKVVNHSKCRPSNYSCRRSNDSGVVKSVFSPTSNASPHISPHSSNPSTNPHENWKLVASELSEKLLHTTRQCDEVLAEVSNLKQLVSEMEKKIGRLDAYCHDHKYLVRFANHHTSSGGVMQSPEPAVWMEHSFPLNDFLQAVQESRSTAQQFGRSLSTEIRRSRLAKPLNEISHLLEPYKIKVTSSFRSLLLGLEALLNQAFYEDFESTGFNQGGSDLILDPYARCISNQADYEEVKGLNWEDVLNNGTRCRSQGLSAFCDQKINTVVKMLGWEQVWGEPLLHDFFRAAKSVWLVHLLCQSVHPALQLFRVEKGCMFESRYMEDIAGEYVPEPTDKSVRLMLAPGFYVYKHVIKCKVMCVHKKKNKFDHKGDIV